MRRAAPILAGLALLATATAGLAQETVRPGDRFLVRPADLPAPHATPSVSNPPAPFPRPKDLKPRVPPGFAVELYASGLDTPRRLLALPFGTVLAVLSGPGDVVRLIDRDDDHRADASSRIVRGLTRPFGIAIRDRTLYLSDTSAVWSVPVNPKSGMPEGKLGALTPPGALGDGSGNWTRNFAIHPDGSHVFVAIGSRDNVAEEPLPRASIQSFRIDGTGQRTVAYGLRNPIGLAFQPGTSRLWTVVDERSGLGEELVPDYLAQIVEGGFYGWPYAYSGSFPQPGFAQRRPEMVSAARMPDVLFRAHSSPIDLVFYTGTGFPPDYRGDAFVALHGSRNAAEPRGYMVARVPFENGVPTGGYEAFMTGFWVDGDNRAHVWGRPAGLAVAPDGALLVADDVGGTIWRIWWTGR